MTNVMNCENKELNPLLQSYVKNSSGPNGREDSWGLVQIHKPSWPQFTHEEITDPDFAINFMAKQMSEGNSKIWTCYRMLYPSKGG